MNRETIMSLIPHQGGMCLWDEVLHWNASSIELRTDTHHQADNPLCSNNRLHAVHLCEYGAQAMAVHGGLLAQTQGGKAPPGMLVALRGVRLYVPRIDDLCEPLVCQADVVANNELSQQYAFRIVCEEQLLAEGRAAVMLRTNATV